MEVKSNLHLHICVSSYGAMKCTEMCDLGGTPAVIPGAGITTGATHLVSFQCSSKCSTSLVWTHSLSDECLSDGDSALSEGKGSSRSRREAESITTTEWKLSTDAHKYEGGKRNSHVPHCSPAPETRRWRRSGPASGTRLSVPAPEQTPEELSETRHRVPPQASRTGHRHWGGGSSCDTGVGTRPLVCPSLCGGPGNPRNKQQRQEVTRIGNRFLSPSLLPPRVSEWPLQTLACPGPEVAPTPTASLRPRKGRSSHLRAGRPRPEPA